MMLIFEDLVIKGDYDFILMYKFLQDHVEMYFGAVRSRFGCNNNPNVVQFMSSYKRLLVHHEVNGRNGNCTALDSTRMLSVSMVQKKTDELEDPFDRTFLVKFDLEDKEPVVSEHDYCDAPRVSGLSEFKKMTVTYIAGFVVRVVQKKLACKTCKGALLSSDVNGSSLE